VQLLIRPLTCDTLNALLLILITTATIVEVSDILTIEQRLMYPLVDDIMSKAQPTSGCVATACLGRVLGKQLSEMLRTLAARIKSGEEVHKSLECHTILLGRFIGESSHHCVEELPRRVAELSSGRRCVSGTLYVGLNSNNIL
jgi:hypothetical protein